MTTPATTTPHQDQFTEVPDKPGSSTIEAGSPGSRSLFTIIARQPFFQGLDKHQLQPLTESALEMKFEPAQSIFQEGSPANRFYLISKAAR